MVHIDIHAVIYADVHCDRHSDADKRAEDRDSGGIDGNRTGNPDADSRYRDGNRDAVDAYADIDGNRHSDADKRAEDRDISGVDGNGAGDADADSGNSHSDVVYTDRHGNTDTYDDVKSWDIGYLRSAFKHLYPQYRGVNYYRRCRIYNFIRRRD